jgi:hypothetical protein
MSGYPLKVAWELRQRQEQAALGRLEDARRARLAAEERATRRRQAREDARAALDAAGPRAPAASVREGADHDRYLARLRDAYQRARAISAEFEAGPLRRAHDVEESARAAHAEARRAREALDRHQQNFREEERRAEERRDDEVADEAARTTRHHRLRD